MNLNSAEGILIVATRYVGLSIAALLAQRHPLVAVDVLPEKVEKINRKEIPIQRLAAEFAKEAKIKLSFTNSKSICS